MAETGGPAGGVKRPRNADASITDSEAGSEQRKRVRGGGRAPLRPADARGVPVVLVSTYKGKERLASREAMGMLAAVAKDVYASPPAAAADSEEDDLLGDLAAEAAALRGGPGAEVPWFLPVAVKNLCMAMVAVNPAHPRAADVDINTLSRRLMANWAEQGHGEGRFVARLFPLQHTCFPDVPSVAGVTKTAFSAFVTRALASGALKAGGVVKLSIVIKARSVPRGVKPPPTLPAATASEAEGAGEAKSAPDAPQAAAAAPQDRVQYLHHGTGMPVLTEIVKSTLAEAGLTAHMVYKGADVLVEVHALQSVAGVSVHTAAEFAAAQGFNLQKAKAALAGAASGGAQEVSTAAAKA